MNISNELEHILAIFGVMFIASVVAIFIGLFWSFICNVIDNIKYSYQIKHRFDKKPIAKCYCKDCRYWGGDNNENYPGCPTSESRYRTGDSFFCKYSYPKDRGVDND